MASGLVQAGHQVTMLAEVPNHPSGIIPPAYRGKWFERSKLDGIDVLHVWVKASPVKSFRSRIALYLTFMANGALVGALQAHGPFDVVYATSPPLFVGGAGLALHCSSARLSSLRYTTCSLNPPFAWGLRSPRAIALATRLEESCYNRASRVVVVTEGIRQQLLVHGQAANKLVLIPNGANTDCSNRSPRLAPSFDSSTACGSMILWWPTPAFMA